MSHLLEVKNLQTHFPTRAGLVKAVNDVSFHINEGELVGLVGESGCGKSITALSVMRLIAPPGKIVAGSITFKRRRIINGKRLANARDSRRRYFDDFSRSDDFIESGLHGRRANRRSAAPASRLE
jgi:ABC-type dipeptide/oligopeptide/nickel transport system ATPase component